MVHQVCMCHENEKNDGDEIHAKKYRKTERPQNRIIEKKHEAYCATASYWEGGGAQLLMANSRNLYRI